MIMQMCPNRAIVDSLECCMEDLIECFEDFIQKSLIIIVLGIGIIVGLLCYLLKMVADRPSPNSATVVPDNTGYINNTRNEVIHNQRNKNVKQEVYEMSNTLKEKEDMKTDKIDNNTTNTRVAKDKTTTANNTLNSPTCSSFDENALRNVGLTCSKHGCCGSSATHIYIPSRVPIPSLATCSSKNNIIPCLRKRSSKKIISSLQICPNMTKPGSCCSMCCYDEPKRKEDLDRQTIYRHKN